MGYSTINKSTAHHNTVLYTGTHSSSSQAVTGVGFQPDWCWLKNRSSNGYDHRTYDAVRGATKLLNINTTNAEGTDAQGLYSFNSDGFSVGTGNGDNNNGDNYASFNWKANGSGSSNTDGNITSTVSANTTAGFSIVRYTGNNNNNQTVGHGLGVAPKMILIKRLGTTLSGTADWVVYHKSITAAKHLHINTTAVESTDNGMFNSTDPTSSVFTIHAGDDVNKNTDQFIAYCFAEIRGYSKIGKYQGTGNSTFIYTGFKPKFIIGKEVSASNGYNWHLFTPKLTGRFEPSNNTTEYTDYPRVVDYCSNGFRWGTSLNNWDNSDGRSYIYYAVGQTMVGTNNVPCTAGSTDG